MTTASSPAQQHADALAAYDRTTSRAGRWTMIVGLMVSLADPVYLVFLSGDVEVSSRQIWTAFTAVAAVFAVIWIIEPLTYFPILGPAAMYQAFMIGNISSKLLPCALVAQGRIDAKAGTRRGDLAAVAAICGAAAVHLMSLFIFVGFFGTWLVATLPADIVATVRTYILPAVIGAVIVQATVTMKQPRIAAIAVAIGLFVEFVLKRAIPDLTFYATVIAVVLTILIAWFSRGRTPIDEKAVLVA